MVFSELYPFIDIYADRLKIYDIDTGDILYDSDKGDEWVTDYDDCEVDNAHIENGCLVIDIVYSFHVIEE